MIAEMPPKLSKNDIKTESKVAQKNATSVSPENAGHELDPAKFVTFPDSPYQLYQPFSPAGDQPAAIDALVEGVEDGLTYQTLLGVTGSGKTFTMANVIARTGRPAIVFAPNKTLAAQLYSEFREFFPKNAVEYFVSYYDYYQPEAYVPQRDLFIEKDSSINEHIEQMRLSATKSLLERRDVVIVATVSAIYGIGNPGDYHSMVMTLRPGDKMSQRDILARLIAMQYERNEMDFKRGVFRVRGDTIDIFPAEHNELALRVELFDDEVESLQFFDPLTGKIRQKIPRFTVYPSSHYVTPRETVLKAIETIKEELRIRLDEFVKDGKLVEAQRLEQRTRFDLEMLNELGFCKGIENYSRHLSRREPGSRPWTLLDYFRTGRATAHNQHIKRFFGSKLGRFALGRAGVDLGLDRRQYQIGHSHPLLPADDDGFGARVHRACACDARATALRFARHRQLAAFRRRTVHADDRHQVAARAVQRQCAGGCGSGGRACHVEFRFDAVDHAVYPHAALARAGAGGAEASLGGAGDSDNPGAGRQGL